MNDFLYQLVAYFEELETGYPVKVGILDDEESILIKPVAGSEIMHEYMNGSLDIKLPFEISIKERNQELAFNAIHELISNLKDFEKALDKKEKNYDFIKLSITEVPALEEGSRDGFFVYTTKISAHLTIF